MKYVIIGNSAAAVGCVESIRKYDSEGSITLISSEPYHTYSRPLISYLLCGKSTEKSMLYRGKSFYTDNRCNALLGHTVNKIDSAAKRVHLDDGSEIEYDRLMISTGSRPFVPPTDGIDCVKKCFTFMSLDDAHALDAALTPDSDVFILGAGLIGLKCAEGIMGKVKSVTVADLSPRILPSILDEEGSHMVQSHLESKGIRFLLSDSVAAFSVSDADGLRNTAHMKSGASVGFDAAVIAVGVRPNTSLAADAGCEVNRGIVIDRQCRTSVSDIYAAGDCAEGYDSSTDAKRILALLPNAYLQGETAGANMAGHASSFDKGIPMNAIGFFGMHIITAGVYSGETYRVVTEGCCKKLFFEDGLLKGFILIGDVARAGIYTSLIREKTPLDSIDFDMIKDKPELMAFSAARRKEILGGKKQ